jgi:imidazole glycerol-phosphate synthase subunit HisH
MGSVAIVDYGSGNLRSAAKAFARVAGQAPNVTADPDAVARADHIVLPGVGAFADCMSGLRKVDGMVEALRDVVIGRGRPFLGICVGMQLMASRGVEFGTHPGLDWIAGEVVRLVPADPQLKVPHMGWNQLAGSWSHPVLDGIKPGEHAYFVHSFHMVTAQPTHCVATVDHGGAVTAAVARDNLFGAQFHPEKSQSVGLRLIGNFLRWKP